MLFRSVSGKPLVMRLCIGDCVRLKIRGNWSIMRIVTIRGNGNVSLAKLGEANVDARNRDAGDPFKYDSKMPGTMQTANARQVAVSTIGEIHMR